MVAGVDWVNETRSVNGDERSVMLPEDWERSVNGESLELTEFRFGNVTLSTLGADFRFSFFSTLISSSFTGLISAGRSLFLFIGALAASMGLGLASSGV